ncbi:hypothetical protein Gasu2_57900 [Galdieria sulphuraria]|uniref:Uncharacterized protein n=1 Tax=Galdieria sulphuraria TaxID=130081 RepID=M2XRU0_GALSU|nr:uncharacterized protein Gasu_59820 [Galdieria sulphuraria]EME26363.1 hypothetical protein Gasu_59820 [Galdieria sulphuraria]GJD11663.1 hypothetical protein Gasu2_57900 [Galdieria sulphuraria]|eukprot:XP_005702883.1 hypothetical protein Gasu_59820 [Galdieria sulphuraria]
MEGNSSDSTTQPQAFRNILYCLLGSTPTLFRLIYNKEVLLFLFWLPGILVEVVLALYLVVRFLRASNIWLLFDSFAVTTILSIAVPVLNTLFVVALVKISGAYGFPYSDTPFSWQTAILYLVMFFQGAFTEETVKYIAVKQGHLDSLKNFVAQAVAVGAGVAIGEQSNQMLDSYYFSKRAWTFSSILIEFWSLFCKFAFHCSTAVFIAFRMVSVPTNLSFLHRYVHIIWIPWCYHFFCNILVTSEDFILEESYSLVVQACTLPLLVLVAVYFIFKTNHSQLLEQSYSRLAEGFVIR